MNQEIKRHQATRLGLIFARYGIKLNRATKLDHIAEIYGDKSWSVKSATPQSGVARERAQAMFTPLQKMVAAGYGHGDYAHYDSMADVQPAEDLLFEFALQEALDAREDIEEYLGMLRTAIGDLEDVLAHVQRLQLEAYPRKTSAFVSKEEPAQTAVVYTTGHVGVRHMDVLGEVDGSDQVEPPQSAREASALLAGSPQIRDRLRNVADTCGAAIVAHEGQFGLLLEKEFLSLEAGSPKANVARRVNLLNLLRELESRWPDSVSGLSAGLRDEAGKRSWKYDVWVVIPLGSNLEQAAGGWYEALNGLV